MGGDTIPFSQSSSTEDIQSAMGKNLRRQSLDSHSVLSNETLISKELSIDKEIDLLFGEFGKKGHRNSPDPVVLEAYQRRAEGIRLEVLHSYEELQRRSYGDLEEIKRKILSYAPGSWMEKTTSVEPGGFCVPEITSLLLIGPQGSGKSSLINRISRMFEDEDFLPERAQVSYNRSSGEGTYFLQEYGIPRGSNSFCLYDSRSLSDDPCENTKMLKRWMTEGVRNGELVKRASDCSSLRTTMKYKARHYNNLSSKVRVVNFVIIVVNGLSVLEAMDNLDEGKKLYTRMIASQFNSPFLSFRDDSPAIVVTHGDLLELSDRVRVRVYLGELLGIPPRTQIFDIAGSNDLASKFSMGDLLLYCLDRADKNLPLKSQPVRKVFGTQIAVRSLPSYLLLVMLVFGMGFVLAQLLVERTGCHPGTAVPSHTPNLSGAPEGEIDSPIDWQAIRHLWLATD